MAIVLFQYDLPLLVNLCIRHTQDTKFTSASYVQTRILIIFEELWEAHIPTGLKPELEYVNGDGRNVLKIEIRPLETESTPYLTDFAQSVMDRIGSCFDKELLFSISIVLKNYRDEYIYIPS